jgi:hypothetical protein
MDDRKYFVARTFRNNEEALKDFLFPISLTQSPDSRGFFCRFIVSINCYDYYRNPPNMPRLSRCY